MGLAVEVPKKTIGEQQEVLDMKNQYSQSPSKSTLVLHGRQTWKRYSKSVTNNQLHKHEKVIKYVCNSHYFFDEYIIFTTYPNNRQEFKVLT